MRKGLQGPRRPGGWRWFLVDTLSCFLVIIICLGLKGGREHADAAVLRYLLCEWGAGGGAGEGASPASFTPPC